MTDAVQLALIAAIAGSTASIIPSCISAWTAIQTAKIKSDILRLEKNTNSIKDALVATTAKASHAEGVADEKARVEGSKDAV